VLGPDGVLPDGNVLALCPESLYLVPQIGLFTLLLFDALAQRMGVVDVDGLELC
jgi:hypothetical protein